MIDKKKRSFLFFLLFGIFLCNALLAELIGVKIFSLEKTLGLPFAQLSILGTRLNFDFTAGVLIWPVVFLVTDLVNEYFGKRGVRLLSFFTAGLIAYAFFVIYLTIGLSPAAFWQELHATDLKGRPFDINFAYARLFGQGLGIIVGSLVAFLLGQLLDVFVFQRVKKITGERHLWLRATGSTLVSQLVDSFVVLFLAFYLLAPKEIRWPLPQLFSVAVLNYTYKFSAALLLTPLIYLSHWLIDRYLGRSLAKKIKQEAVKESQNFF